jgi:hypothetical protein
MKSAFTSAVALCIDLEVGLAVAVGVALDDGDVTNSVVLNLQLASLAVKVPSARTSHR